MNVIGLNSYLKHEPALFFTLLFDQLLTAFLELANEDRFVTTRTPDEMIHNQVDAVLISLIIVSIHVIIILDNRQHARAEAHEKPPHRPG